MPGPTDYLAAERTFLAWIRTSLALMGLGFVVARFGLFLQALQSGVANPVVRPTGTSFWFGTALIILAALVTLGSLIRYVRMVRDLRTGTPLLDRPSALAIGVAIVLALVGIIMAIYLISVRNPSPENKSMNSGIITQPSLHSVDQTVQKIEDLLQAKGVKLFALVDHSGEAEKAGLEMRPTKLLIFGNPKGGTPLMVAAPTIALDLPLKILVWEDADGKVHVSYNSPAYLQSRHDLPQELVQNIAIIETLASAAAH